MDLLRKNFYTVLHNHLNENFDSLWTIRKMINILILFVFTLGYIFNLAWMQFIILQTNRQYSFFAVK